jgi:hypothetical protein
MTLLLSSRACSDVAAALRRSAPSLRDLAEGQWELMLQEAVPSPVSARLADSFLLFDAPAPAVCALAQAPLWLRWNLSLPGNAKIVLAPNPWRLRLRAELALDDDTTLEARVGESLLGLQAACRLLTEDATGSEAAAPQQASSAGAPASSPRLFSLLREMGRTFTERSAQVASLDLPGRGCCCRVLVEEDSMALRASVDFLSISSPDGQCPLAVAVLLLSAGGALRLARPFAAHAGDEVACGFEVRFGGETTAGELEHGLGALAVAAWTCKEEALCLLDHAAAESYLALRNLPPTLATEEFHHG